MVNHVSVAIALIVVGEPSSLLGTAECEEVAESRDYFVGRAGVLAGDNTLQNERGTPFDSPAARTDRR